MIDEQKALREAVARASYERWRTTRPKAPAFDVLHSDAMESELAGADAALAVALEKAAKVAADKTEYWYPQVGNEIAAAIRALIIRNP